MVARPTWESLGHSVVARSASEHRGTELRYPVSPVGISRVSAFAVSGSPGFLIDTETPMSGWPPAWLADENAENDPISPAALALAAATVDTAEQRATAMAIRIIRAITSIPNTAWSKGMLE